MRRKTTIELSDLLAAPTDALREARRTIDADGVLSRAEWELVAHFAQQGLETLAMNTPNRVSSDALLAVVDAFAAVYDLLQRPDTRRQAYYLGNLPAECRLARPANSDEAPTSNAVRTAVAETRRRVLKSTGLFVPFVAARNLPVLLSEDTLPSAEALHVALRPYWPVLWQLAVHGHDAATGRLLRTQSGDEG
jgi:hypothetical protein